MFSAAPLSRLSPTTKKFSDARVGEVAAHAADERSRRGPPTPAASARSSTTRFGNARSASSASSRSGSRANVARTAIEWPTTTGTRTQVGVTRELGDAEDLARLVLELHLLVGVAVVAQRAEQRHDVEGQRVRVDLRARPRAPRPRRRRSSAGRRGRPARPARPARRCPSARRRRRPGSSSRPSRSARSASCSALAGSITTIVVQFGLATMPLRRVVDRRRG